MREAMRLLAAFWRHVVLRRPVDVPPLYDPFAGTPHTD